MKLGLLAASLVLVAGGAVGCGDDDSSGSGTAGDGGAKSDDSASTEDFCAAFKGFSDDLAGLTGQEKDLGKLLKEAAQKVEDAGTPEDISDDAKDGLQLTLDALQDLPDDATVDDMSGLEDDFSDADKKKTDAFSDYLQKTCPELGDSGSDNGSSDSSNAPGTDSGTDSGSGSSEPSEGS